MWRAKKEALNQSMMINQEKRKKVWKKWEDEEEAKV
jgi:hypothetical protein